MDKKEFGNRLKEFAKSKFGKLDLLANALDMSPQSLQSYLTGRSLPGTKLLSKLAELGCDINWLLNIENINEANQVSEESKIYTVKDKIILSQAEEIFELKKVLKDLSEKIDQLERLQEVMLKVAGSKEELKQVKKIK